MPRSKEPLKLLEAKGKSHLTKKEKGEREQGEVKTPTPKQVRAPDWLPQNLRKEFNSLSRQLLKIGIFSNLDRDTLARYLIAHEIYLKATSHIQEAISLGSSSEAVKWTSVQGKYFSQCRECANDLGLTITSRCKLVLPKSGQPEENPFEKMMRERQNRA